MYLEKQKLWLFFGYIHIHECFHFVYPIRILLSTSIVVSTTELYWIQFFVVVVTEIFLLILSVSGIAGQQTLDPKRHMITPRQFAAYRSKLMS